MIAVAGDADFAAAAGARAIGDADAGIVASAVVVAAGGEREGAHQNEAHFAGEYTYYGTFERN
jgi:hypothetical protein